MAKSRQRNARARPRTSLVGRGARFLFCPACGYFEPSWRSLCPGCRVMDDGKARTSAEREETALATETSTSDSMPWPLRVGAVVVAVIVLPVYGVWGGGGTLVTVALVALVVGLLLFAIHDGEKPTVDRGGNALRRLTFESPRSRGELTVTGKGVVEAHWSTDEPLGERLELSAFAKLDAIELKARARVLPEGPEATRMAVAAAFASLARSSPRALRPILRTSWSRVAGEAAVADEPELTLAVGPEGGARYTSVVELLEAVPAGLAPAPAVSGGAFRTAADRLGEHAEDALRGIELAAPRAFAHLVADAARNRHAW